MIYTYSACCNTHTNFLKDIKTAIWNADQFICILYIYYLKRVCSVNPTQPNPSHAKLPTSRPIIIWGISKKNSLFTDECWSVSVGSKMSFLLSLFLFSRLLDGNPGYRLSVLRKRNMYRLQANNTYNRVTLCFWNLWIKEEMDRKSATKGLTVETIVNRYRGGKERGTKVRVYSHL